MIEINYQCIQLQASARFIVCLSTHFLLPVSQAIVSSLLWRQPETKESADGLGSLISFPYDEF